MTSREWENALARRIDADAREEARRQAWARDFAAAWNARFFALLAEDERAARDAKPRLPRARGFVRR